MTPQRQPQQISTTAYTLSANDENGYLYTTNSSAVTITVPPNTMDIGAVVTLDQEGTGKVTVVGGNGVTVNPVATLSIANRYGVAGLYQVSLNTWTFFGNISA